MGRGYGVGNYDTSVFGVTNYVDGTATVVAGANVSTTANVLFLSAASDSATSQFISQAGVVQFASSNVGAFSAIQTHGGFVKIVAPVVQSSTQTLTNFERVREFAPTVPAQSSLSVSAERIHLASSEDNMFSDISARAEFVVSAEANLAGSSTTNVPRTSILVTRSFLLPSNAVQQSRAVADWSTPARLAKAKSRFESQAFYTAWSAGEIFGVSQVNANGREKWENNEQVSDNWVTAADIADAWTPVEETSNTWTQINSPYR